MLRHLFPSVLRRRPALSPIPQDTAPQPRVLSMADAITRTLSANAHVPLRRREIYDLIVEQYRGVRYRVFADVLNQLVRVDRTITCIRPARRMTRRQRAKRSRFVLSAA